jgi:UDPglucose--hexose-1-phosphate uridylyltransferase
MPELRRDPVIGRWVIISSERGRKPSDFGLQPENDDKVCPFCPGNEHITPNEILAYRDPESLKDKPGWWVRVIANKFPALGIEGGINRAGEGMYDKMNGFGAHEIVIETTNHKKDFSHLEDKKAEDVIWVYRDRILDLKKDVRFEYVLIFKNRGLAAGASISHPHSQLIALPMVPMRVKQEIQGSKTYFDYKERCVFCDIIKQEITAEQRVVAENDDFIAVCPFASRFPFEIWIIPKLHDSHFEDILKHEVMMLAQIMKNVLNKLNRVLDNPPYNYLLHTSPLREGLSTSYHWHIEIMPKLSKIAGFEWGTGFYINPTPPEEAAKYLRETE